MVCEQDRLPVQLLFLPPDSQNFFALCQIFSQCVDQSGFLKLSRVDKAGQEQ
jgi:hypothetical protein